MEPVPYGFCHCRCGQKTKPCSKTATIKGWIKGEPLRFITGHNVARINDGLSRQERRYEKLKSLGLCILCGKGKVQSTVLCEKCRIEDRNKRRLFYKNPSLKLAQGSRVPTKQPKKPIRGCRLCGQPVSKAVCKYCDNHRSHPCRECGKKIQITRGRAGRYCSSKCQSIGESKKRGPLCKNWKGGKTAEKILIRHRLEYREWRKAVYERDNWTCQDCGARSRRGNLVHLEAHHIKEFADYPKLRTEVSNGMTLCKPCHDEWHKINKQRRKSGNDFGVVKPNSGNRVRSRNNGRGSFVHQ